MKIRIKFRKYGVMKFIGHLDIMRFFQKAVRRSGIDICYSEGFSPHQVMSFAAPLGVGITSDGEYLDIEVHQSDSSEASMAGLNAVMPHGMEITGYVQLDDKTKAAMSVVSAADYEIWHKNSAQVPECLRDAGFLSQQLQEFFEKPQQVLVAKKTKKSEKTMDLKQLVYDFQILPPNAQSGGMPVYYLNASTGSTDNLKPELALEAFYRHMGLEFDAACVQIHRKDVYFTDAGGVNRPLLEAGKEIRQS